VRCFVNNAEGQLTSNIAVAHHPEGAISAFLEASLET
jgi:hypothetical protein